MTRGHNALTSTQSDIMAEAASTKSCNVVLEGLPPNYQETVSRSPESSAGQGEQDTVSDESAGVDSDSGESLFITQKPVPEAARSRRRRRDNLRAGPTSSPELEESDSDTSSFSSPGESKANRERKTKTCKLPKYSFPFLSGGKPDTSQLPVKLNISLNNAVMGGFFNCVRELWRGDERVDDVESSLPTLDMDGDNISPLSEEEEERSEDEDIKVVERKCLVAPSKTKRRQTWCNQLRQERTRKAGNASQEASQGRQCKTLHKIPAKAAILRATPLCLDTESADDGGRVEKDENNEPVTSDGNFLVQMETPNTTRHLTRGNKEIVFQQKDTEEELCNDSDATVCEPQKLQRSPSKYTQKSREASTSEAETKTEVLHMDNLSQTGQTEDEPKNQNHLHSLPLLLSDSNNDSACSETRAKKRKNKKKNRDHESIEEENSQSQEEPEDVHAVKSVNVEETPSLSEYSSAEPLASQVSDELEFNEINRMENLSHVDTIVRQKKRDKRKKSAGDSVRQEVDGNLEADVEMEDSVFPESCNVENGGKKKKKKKRVRSDEDVEQLQSSTAAEPLNHDAEPQMKMKKRKKEEVVDAEEGEEEEASNRAVGLPPVSTGQLEESANGLESTAASEETLESSQVKRKKHKKKKQFSNHDVQDGEEGGDGSFSNDAVTLEEHTVVLLKKKKKEKATSEGLDSSYAPEENKKVEDECNTQKTKEGLEDQSAELVTKKKKKKNKMKSSRNICEDGVTQSDESVSVQEKEKKRTSSFLVADAEENDAQSEKKSPSHSVDARVWGAEKPAVSAADVETESAEITGKLEESNDGVRKKKKKRKRKMSVQQDSAEKDHERDFEEANQTCQSALPETKDASELVTPMERVESAADAAATDEDVLLKKKKKKKKKKREDDSASDQDTKETLKMVKQASPCLETPGNLALNDIRDKKKKIKSPHKILLEGKLLSTSESSTSEKSSSNRVVKNKHRTAKRSLYNQSQDFFTGC